MQSSFECGLAGAAAVRIPWHELPALRKAPAGPGSESLSAAIRMSDEQTVVGLAALARASASAGSMSDWGVVASARYFGRLRFANTLERLRKLHVRGVSPLVVPHLSLHSIAGTLSLALGLHGPHFGVGGGPEHLTELLSLGLGVLRRERIPGLWLVATELSPDPTLHPGGEPVVEGLAQGVALALTANGTSGRLRLVQGTSAADEANLTSLVDHVLESPNETWYCGLRGLGTIELHGAAAAALPRAA